MDKNLFTDIGIPTANYWRIKNQDLYGKINCIQLIEGEHSDLNNSGRYIHIVGNGISEEEPSNAYILDTKGNGWYQNGVSAGFADKAFQTPLSQSGAKVFKFAEHTYTQDDWNKKRYYLTYVTDNMKYKPFSIVLGENYDFLGTITSVVKNESDNGGYITVDNYKIPNKDSNTTIYDDSYILLPYDRIESSDSYTWNNQYVNEGAHLLGDSIIGTGGAAFGYDNHVLAIGGISAGLSNISAGKYSGTFGRYNVTGYCDFAFGQNMKLLGHWITGFGRDNFASTGADYSVIGGLRNEIYNKYCTAFGRGHVMKMEDTNARGRYSETDNDRRYVDRVGYGSSDNDRKNIYTLDKDGNGWFRGNLRVGGNNYDDANEFLYVKKYDDIDELTVNESLTGDLAQAPHSIANWTIDNSYKIVLENVIGDNQYKIATKNGIECIEIQVRNDSAKPGYRYYAYFQLSEFTDGQSTSDSYTIKIKYLDNGNAPICLQYAKSKVGISNGNPEIIRTNTGQWKTFKWKIDNALFANESILHDKYHFRLFTTSVDIGTDEIYLAEVSVEKGNDLYILNSSGRDGYKEIYNWAKLTATSNDYNALINAPMINLPTNTNLDNVIEPGIYTGKNTANYNGMPYEMPYLLLVANHCNEWGTIDKPVICQTKIGCLNIATTTSKEIVQWRYQNENNEWAPWKNISADDEVIHPEIMSTVDQEYNPESANAQSGIAVAQAISQISTGGGGEQTPTYLTEYFKVLPEDYDIDMLLDEGKYIVNKRIDVADYIETITVRRGVNNYEDFDSEYQTIYQVKECFDSNGYQMLIRDKVSDYQWSEWQDCFGGGGSDDKLFTYEPQLEITVEEAVNTVTITEIGGISLSDYNYTALKCVVENAVLETKGPNAQVTVYVNSKAYDKYQTPLGSPTTFINADKKLYWGCYADIKSGLMLSASSSVSNETWSSTMYMPINSQNLHRKDKIEYLNISIVMHETFPIGTKFKLWFK